MCRNKSPVERLGKQKLAHSNNFPERQFRIKFEYEGIISAFRNVNYLNYSYVTLFYKM